MILCVKADVEQYMLISLSSKLLNKNKNRLNIEQSFRDLIAEVNKMSTFQICLDAGFQKHFEHLRFTTVRRCVVHTFTFINLVPNDIFQIVNYFVTATEIFIL